MQIQTNSSKEKYENSGGWELSGRYKNSSPLQFHAKEIMFVASPQLPPPTTVSNFKRTKFYSLKTGGLNDTLLLRPDGQKINVVSGLIRDIDVEKSTTVIGS